MISGVGNRTAGLLLAAAAASGTVRPAAAQAVRALRLPPEFVIDQWTTRDGLPQNSVNAIARAPDGALWLGTFGGLVRFDGASFTLQERADRAGRHVDRVLSLAVAPDSSLWIGTETGLLHRTGSQYQVFSDADGLTDNTISVLFLDHDGVLWIGTPRGGVMRRDGDRFTAVTEVDGVRLGPVTAIVEDPQQSVWVSAGDRIVTFSAAARIARWASPPVRDALALMLVDRAGQEWFSLYDGVARVAGASVRAWRRGSGLGRPSVVVQGPRAGFWLGTVNDGLFHFEPDGDQAVRRYALPDGRQEFRVRAALADGEGGVWFGTDAHGLLRARRNLFTTFTSEHGLSHDVATAVFVDSRGVVWGGTNCGGVNAIRLAARTVQTFKPRRPADPRGDPCVFAITESPRGTMWFGTYGGGLSRLRDGREDRLWRAGGLRDTVVLALFTGRDGTTWVGTNAGGLAMLQDGRVRKVYTTADGLANNSVRVIYEARDGVLWVGTLGGLSRLQDGRLTSYHAADGLSSEQVRAIYEDAQGDLWVGTYGGGLNRFYDGGFTPITQRDGLADDVVSSILEDGQGRFWFSGNKGISRVSRQELVAFTEGRQGRVTSVLYGEEDGLQNAETNGGFQPAAAKDGAGRLWFPTVRGLAMVDPALVTTMGSPPGVTVEEVVVDGVAQPLGEPIVVGPGRPNLEFRYAGLSLSAPKHLSFRYRLIGFDENWVEAGSRRVAYYPRLSHGQYRFLVRAANRDGVWNEAGAGLRLRVLAPVWSRWWFRLAVAAALLGAVALVGWRRVTAARLRRAARAEFSRRLIESQERERKRIAGELHDGLGQELLVVKNRALLALGSEGLPAPARAHLEQISDIATQSLDSVRGLAHHLTPYQLDHLGLSTALRTMIETAAGGGTIAFHATIEDVDHLQPVTRQINLYRIVQEAVSNVVRHSGAGAADVRIRCLDGVITVTIRDDGHGFRVRSDGAGGLSGGFGLSGMAERVRILGGRIELFSAPGEGTRLEVTVPIAAPPEPEQS